MLFTVVVPLRDRVELAHDAVRGALGQTLPPVEVLIIDDGSVEAGVDELAELGPRVRVLRQEPRGVGAARNAGLAAATTDWVAFLDADDRWHPDHLAELDRIVRAHPDAALVATDHLQTLDRSLPTGPAGPGRIRRIAYLPAAGRRIGVVWTSAAAVRRAVVVELGGFGPWPHGEDLELWARVGLHHPVAISTARTARYVRGTGGAMEMSHAQDGWHLPATHDDLSPSAGTVAAALARGDHRVPARHLEAYLDGRVLGLLRSAALAGDRAGVAAAVRLTIRTRRPRVVVLRAVAGLPGTSALLDRMRWLRRCARGLVSAVRS